MIYTTCIVEASPIQSTLVAFLARVNGITRTPPFLEHRMWPFERPNKYCATI